MTIRDRMHREEGAVITIVAIVLPVLLLLSAAGVSGFTLFASHRELQRAADQAALAGGAALPPFDPNVVVDDPTYPIPGTEAVYDNLDELGLTPPPPPKMSDIIPDPRAIACAYGSNALGSESAALMSSIEDQGSFEVPLNDAGEPLHTACEDIRVYPRIEPNPHNTTPVECTNRLVQQVAADHGLFDPDDPSDPTIVQQTIDAIVKMPLNHVLPAAFTPRFQVTVYSQVNPPLLSLITGSDGMQIGARAVAYRRIKNAVVVPILPATKTQIDLGLIDPIEAMTDPVNLNLALARSQRKLIEAIDDADNRLDRVMGALGLPCQHLLHNLRQDLRDIYDPPTGEAPTAREIVDATITAAENTASRTGEAFPDPDNPDSLAGDAVLLIGVTVDEFMNPISALQIPILDAALVVMDEVADGDYRAAVVSAANARGAWRASLVE